MSNGIRLPPRESIIKERELKVSSFAPEEENKFSDYEGPHQSLFNNSTDWLAGAKVTTRQGFIEPVGFITRLPVREGIFGAAWAASEKICMNAKADLPVPEEHRGNRVGPPGTVKWAAGENIYGHIAEEDRMCTFKDLELDVNKQGSAALVSFLKEAKEGGCFAYVCQENEFISHAPYMSTQNSSVHYDVMLGETVPMEVKNAELGKWWKGQKNCNYSFGNFKRQPIRIVVPTGLTLSWNDSFFEKLATELINLCTLTDLSKYTVENPLEIKAERESGRLIMNVEKINRSFTLEKIPAAEVPWPMHALKNKLLVSGAPTRFLPSPIPEVNELMNTLNKYKDTSVQVIQAKAWAIWGLERAIEMYTAQRTGEVTENSSFNVFNVNYRNMYRPKPGFVREDCSKGSGFSLVLDNAQYEAVCRSLLLKGISKSPMPIANTLQYNRFLFGKDMGTALGHIDNLFLYDYGGDWTMPAVRLWLAGMKNMISEVHAVAEDTAKTLIEATAISYELVRAKKKYEDNMRREGVHLTRICSWKDPRQMLHYRIIDAVFLKSTTASSMDDEAYDAIGFACIMHDVTDYGYDLSVCDCSNMLFTFGATDGSYEGLELAYAAVTAGLEYVADVHRYNASGLTLASTHYWQICNGRHRILNCAMSVAQHKLPRRLSRKNTLVETIFGRNSDEFSEQPIHSHALCLYIYGRLKMRTVELGKPYTTLLRCLVARPYERIFNRELDDIEGLHEVDNITSILECVCVESSDEGIELLWDIALFMWRETAIMWHAFLGSLLMSYDRIAGDDTAGYGYEYRPWFST